MKKCPFCAEEIQGEAIKCKHCGEWLTVSQEGKYISDKQESVHREAKKDKINAELNTTVYIAPKTIESENPEVMDDEDNSKYREIPGAKSLIKKPGKYGWGWFLFLAIFAIGHKASYFYNPAISVIEKFSIVPLLAIYFWLRNRFLKKIKYGGIKWLPGFKAGLFTYLIWCVLIIPTAIFDMSLKNADINEVSKKYYDKAKNMQQEEQQLINSIIKEPQSAEDFRFNAAQIDAVLTFAEQKRNMSSAMFNELKAILSKDGERGKEKIDSISRLETLGDRQYETQKKAWVALKKYFITKNDSFFNEYTALEADADRLRSEYQDLTKIVFN